MNDASVNNTQASATESYGMMLRIARQQQGLSIEELANDTRIFRQHIDDLENNDASNIRSSGYVVGYLRTLAKRLSLDADRLIDEFRESVEEEQRTNVLEKYVTAKPDKTRTQGVDRVNIAIFAVIGVIILILIAGFAWWYFVSNYGPDSNSEPTMSETVKDDEQTAVPSTPTETKEQLSASSERLISNEDVDPPDRTEETIDEVLEEFRNTQSVPDSEMSSQETDETLENPITSTGLPVGDEVQEDTEDIDNIVVSQDSDDVAEEEITTAEPPPKLRLQFTLDSWVTVTDGDGNLLVNGTQSSGTTLELDGEEPFSIQLGVASGVTVEFDGEMISLDEYTDGDVAQFTLPP